MAVKGPMLENEDGQSVIEFLLFLPLMVLMVFTTLRVNTAIQMSIVNQKYARAQTLILANHAAYYPRAQLRNEDGNFFGAKNVDQMVLGVSDNKATEGYEPEASIVEITRKGKAFGNNDDQTEDHKERGKIRIRNSVTLCTQFNPARADIVSDANDLRSLYQSGGFRFCRGGK